MKSLCARRTVSSRETHLELTPHPLKSRHTVRSVCSSTKHEGKPALHVPTENLTKYRALKRISDQYDRLGNALSNIGAYPEANMAWAQTAKWNLRAQELRVPGHKESTFDNHPKLPPVEGDMSESYS